MGITVNIGKLKDTVYVCNGCCCGHEEKGNPKVLNELFDAEMKDIIAIERPYCLGPCEQANTVKITLDNINYWFKRINSEQDVKDIKHFIKTKELTDNLRNKELEM